MDRGSEGETCNAGNCDSAAGLLHIVFFITHEKGFFPDFRHKLEALTHVFVRCDLGNSMTLCDAVV